ncbi:MAG: hypothetical protein JSW08_02330 [archaeon]|nr:MAG: hypothetical protein JSW08_02330 [archaeon]
MNKIWLVTLIVVVVGGTLFGLTTFVNAGDGQAAFECEDCGNQCTAKNNCGLESCGALNGGSCNCNAESDCGGGCTQGNTCGASSCQAQQGRTCGCGAR